MNELSEKINNWSKIDKEIVKINEYLKNLKYYKSKTENDILNIIKSNNLTEKKIRFNNNHFVYNISHSLPPLSLTLLEKVLSDNLNNQAKTHILNEIKTYRENNKSQSISLKKKKIRKTKSNSLKK